MVVSREPHINLRDINAVLQEHGKMLKLRYARIITPKGYEPMEIWALWTDSRDIFTRRWWRTRGYLSRSRKYIGFEKEEESVRKHFTYAESPDCSRAAYITECPDFDDQRNVIQIIDTLQDRAIKSIVIADKTLHGPLHLGGPFYKLRFSRDNRKLIYFARPTEEQKIAANGKTREFIMGIYDFRTNKISLVTDETLTTGCFDRIMEWTPDNKGIVYVSQERITWHRLGEEYFNTILTDAYRVEKLTFSPNGKLLAVFMALSYNDSDKRCVCLLKWPLVRAATLKHDTISLGNYKIYSIPPRPWANNGKQLLFNVVWQTEVRVAAIDISTFKVFELPLPNPSIVKDVRADEMLLETCAANRPTQLWYAKLPVDLHDTMEPATCLITQRLHEQQCLDFAVKMHYFEDRAYSAVMIHPDNSIGTGLSLVVMPWWGPEPYYTVHHRIPIINTFVSFGYCVLVVNYRRPYVEVMRVVEFPNLNGAEHVADCHNAVVDILEEYGEFIDPEKVYLYGQQYGSFMAVLMINEHEYFYKRTALVRPMLEYPQFYLTLNPDLEQLHPYFKVDKIYSPVLLIIDEEYKEDKYMDLERAMKRNLVPIVRATKKKWPSDSWIYNVIDFYQNLLRRESSSSDDVQYVAC